MTPTPASCSSRKTTSGLPILRIDADGDPRVFVSDARVVASSEIAALLAEAAIEVGATMDDDDEDEDDDDG